MARFTDEQLARWAKEHRIIAEQMAREYLAQERDRSRDTVLRLFSGTHQMIVFRTLFRSGWRYSCDRHHEQGSPN